jgi:mannose/fructose/N-acetylgalactosamine-specific phosphotransferase system component IIC
MSDLLPFSLLGALLGLDVVSFPQAMISRPIVAATLAGALAGDTASGLLVGVLLEMVALETLPVGASRYPEWGTASVVGGALFAAASAERAGALVLSVVAAIATAWVGGWSMYALRRLNGVWAKRALPALDAGARGAVVGLQLRGLGADLLRGALLTFVALLLFRPALGLLVGRWALNDTVSLAVVAGLAAAVAGGAAWRLGHVASHARLFLIGGLVVGLAALVLL